jgi:hypothetical protein
MNARAEIREQFFAAGDELDDAVYPQLYNLSARFFFRFLPRPAIPAQPEFLYLPMPRQSARGSKGRTAFIGVLAKWNMAWEAAQLRFILFERDLRKFAPRIRLPDAANTYLLPATEHRLEAFAPLYLLLPRTTIERFGLPLLRKVTWPQSLLSDAETLQALQGPGPVRRARAG